MAALTLPLLADDPACAMCGRPVAACICPACPVCGGFGDPDCYTHHGLTCTDAQTRAKRAWAILSEIEASLERLAILPDLDLPAADIAAEQAAELATLIGWSSRPELTEAALTGGVRVPQRG